VKPGTGDFDHKGSEYGSSRMHCKKFGVPLLINQPLLPTANAWSLRSRPTLLRQLRILRAHTTKWLAPPSLNISSSWQ